MMISSPHMLRRFCCFTTVVASSSSSNTQKKRLVFMGSPQVSASVLDNLLTASSAPESIFEISAVVTQPPSGRDIRGRKGRSTYIPACFLWRSSCSKSFTGWCERNRSFVGPVIAQEKVDINDEIKSPNLLDLLFARGSKLLIHHLPSILDGSAKANALPQDESNATLAPKINPEESWLSFDENATVLHDKVRAFAGWPGTRAKGEMDDDVFFSKGSLIFRCGEGTALEVLEVQLLGKRIVPLHIQLTNYMYVRR